MPWKLNPSGVTFELARGETLGFNQSTRRHSSPATPTERKIERISVQFSARSGWQGLIISFNLPRVPLTLYPRLFQTSPLWGSTAPLH